MTDHNDVLPEIEPREFAGWLKTRPGLVILDVREPYEVELAALPDPRVAVVPLSRLARLLERGLPPGLTPESEIVVLCHLGERSAQVTYWLHNRLGYLNVHNLRGGIDAYARQVDPTIRLY